MRKLKKYFISGLLFLVPVVISGWVLWKSIFFLEGFIGNILKHYLPDWYIPGAGFLSLILLILLLGFLTNNFIGRPLLSFIEGFFQSMPFINKLFSFLKEVITNITKQEWKNFQAVVKLKSPIGGYTIGFITGEVPSAGPEKYFSVIVPTVPNPTTGFYLIAPESGLERLDISIEEGIKFIVSLGMFQPEKWQESR